MRSGVDMININSIILQSTCTNLESVIKPLLILDYILNDNVNKDNQISNDSETALALSNLFSLVLSEQEYVGNQYVLNSFRAYATKRWRIDIDIRLFAFSVETTPFKNITQTRLKLASMVEFEHFYEQNSFKNWRNSVQTRPC